MTSRSPVVKEPIPIYSADDGLITQPIGDWGIQKYRLVGMYNKLFSTGMKKKWDRRVYIDLFAGSGKAQLKSSGKIVFGSPLLALSVPDPFDRYIFCEQNAKAMQALQQRISESFRASDVHFVRGDCNERVDEIVAKIPQYSATTKVLSFCFVDPFSLNIHFETIKRLATHIVDFLILIMIMDPTRNEGLYVKENSRRIDLFLGLSDWRDRWREAKGQNISIRQFLATEFAKQMINLGYRNESLKSMVKTNSGDKNLSLYYLAFFSKHQLGYKFWNQVRKYATDQISLEI
jgi:three-Cys-motif partner protein